MSQPHTHSQAPAFVITGEQIRSRIDDSIAQIRAARESYVSSNEIKRGGFDWKYAVAEADARIKSLGLIRQYVADGENRLGICDLTDILNQTCGMDTADEVMAKPRRRPDGLAALAHALGQDA